MPSYGDFIMPPPLTQDAPPPNHEICRALGCLGCFDCRDDDSDATWDGKDAEPGWDAEPDTDITD